MSATAPDATAPDAPAPEQSAWGWTGDDEADFTQDWFAHLMTTPPPLNSQMPESSPTAPPAGIQGELSLTL